MDEEFDEQLDALRASYRKLKNQYNQLCNRLKNWNKDHEIQQAHRQAKYTREHALMILSDKELKAVEDFRNEHYTKCALPYHSKTKGNTYIYTLTGTGIGTIIETSEG